MPCYSLFIHIERCFWTQSVVGREKHVIFFYDRFVHTIIVIKGKLEFFSCVSYLGYTSVCTFNVFSSIDGRKPKKKKKNLVGLKPFEPVKPAHATRHFCFKVKILGIVTVWRIAHKLKVRNGEKVTCIWERKKKGRTTCTLCTFPAAKHVSCYEKKKTFSRLIISHEIWRTRESVLAFLWKSELIL